MFEWFIISMLYLVGAAIGIHLSGYTCKRLSHAEIDEEIELEQKMIARIEQENFEYLYEEPLNELPLTYLDDDYIQSLKTQMVEHKVPGNRVRMFYDACKEGFCYFTERGDVSYKYLNVVCRHYVIENKCKALYREGIETTEFVPNLPEIDSCFKRNKPRPPVYETKRVNRFIHLGTFDDYHKTTTIVPTHAISFQDFLNKR
jgi:hypothetical protein